MSSAADILRALSCGAPACPCVRAASAGHGLTHCPAHDDAHPSLSVSTGEGGAVWHCHAGCTQDAVTTALHAVGILGRDGAASAPPSARVTRYLIRDVAGQVQAVHVRTDSPPAPKRFRWERADGSHGLGGRAASSLPLYGAERLADAAEGARVIVTEGERAADALTSRGVVAVGTVTGAASTPDPETLRVLTACEVVLWPDYDDVGRAHMARIGERLRVLGIVARVVVWGDRESDDAADYCARGGTVEGLDALLAEAKAWTPDGATASQAATDAPSSPARETVVTLYQDIHAEPVVWLWQR